MTNPGSQSRRNAYNTQKMWFIEEFPYRWMYSQDCTQRNANVFLKRQLIMIVINNNFLSILAKVQKSVIPTKILNIHGEFHRRLKMIIV